MVRAHHAPLPFRGPSGAASRAWLQVYVSSDRRAALALLIDGADNPGTSTVNGAAQAAEAALPALLACAPDAHVRWVDVQTEGDAGLPAPRCAWIDFAHTAPHRGASWRHLPTPDLEALVGPLELP